MDWFWEHWEKIAFLVSIVASLATAFTIWRKDHERHAEKQEARDEAILAALNALTEVAKTAASDAAANAANHSAEHHKLMAIARDIQGALTQLSATLERLQLATGTEHRDIEKELARQSANVEGLIRRAERA